MRSSWALDNPGIVNYEGRGESVPIKMFPQRCMDTFLRLYHQAQMKKDKSMFFIIFVSLILRKRKLKWFPGILTKRWLSLSKNSFIPLWEACISGRGPKDTRSHLYSHKRLMHPLLPTISIVASIMWWFFILTRTLPVMHQSWRWLKEKTTLYWLYNY